jgi:hypothetical protein
VGRDRDYPPEAVKQNEAAAILLVSIHIAGVNIVLASPRSRMKPCSVWRMVVQKGALAAVA